MMDENLDELMSRVELRISELEELMKTIEDEIGNLDARLPRLDYKKSSGVAIDSDV